MNVRPATAADAEQILRIYAPIVAASAISFELETPDADEMRSRIEAASKHHAWLVSEDEAGDVSGYAYASRHRERPAYQWSTDTTVYIREDCRGQGLGRALYAALFDQLIRLGYFQAFAGIALPNDASVALHEAVGFKPLGVYRNVGFKLGRWHDVGWWQKELRAPAKPLTPGRPGNALPGT